MLLLTGGESVHGIHLVKAKAGGLALNPPSPCSTCSPSLSAGLGQPAPVLAGLSSVGLLGAPLPQRSAQATSLQGLLVTLGSLAPTRTQALLQFSFLVCWIKSTNYNEI